MNKLDIRLIYLQLNTTYIYENFCEFSQTKWLLFHKGCVTPQHLPKKTSSILLLHQKHLHQAFWDVIATRNSNGPWT